MALHASVHAGFRPSVSGTTPSAEADPLLSAIIVNWNTQDLLRESLSSLRTCLARVALETIVVDNGSIDGSPEMVAAEFPEVRLICNSENLGFGRGNNIGMAAATGRYFLLLNSDACLQDDSILSLVGRVRDRPEVGVAGPRLRFPDGRLQASAFRFTTLARLAVEELGLYKVLPRTRRAELLLGGYWDHQGEREVDWLKGACLVVRREVFEATGGFDPSIFLYGEEEEWSRRIKAAGWSLLFTPSSEVIHLGHGSQAHLSESSRFRRCLHSADRLLSRRRGWAATATASLLRMAGALIKLMLFSLHRPLGRDRSYAREVRLRSLVVLGHYFRVPFTRKGGPARPEPRAALTATRARP